MIMLFILISLIMIFSMLILINFYISPLKALSREKMTSFECGFDPFNSARMPFSIQFYIIALIFLIFDVEIIIFFPLIPSLSLKSIEMNSIMSILFILILLLGLYIEWYDGALKWIK
uniref:NADH-ubiquinone oxidoreductase chain 3 n=1 Tax=Ichneumonidae sp. MT-2014 TaxID=1560014 RepID=A0A0A0S1P2_9HYME|nr:NADH dehydrogenase subunit 3 [Ichneumonidae sp. MT-2014]